MMIKFPLAHLCPDLLISILFAFGMTVWDEQGPCCLISSLFINSFLLYSHVLLCNKQEK